MRYGMVIDIKRCIGCYGCQIFCKTENATPPGKFRSRVLFYEIGKYPDVKKMPLPVLCMHCAEPACVSVCPTGASVKNANGIVTVDQQKCTGCLNCVTACPYGARYLFPEGSENFPGQGMTPYENEGYRKHRRGVIDKCDFCQSRLNRGLEPSCVANCMCRARFFGDLDDPDSEVAKLIKEVDRVFQVYPGVAPGTRVEDPDLVPSVFYLLPYKRK